MKDIEEKNAQYKNELLTLKEKSKQLGLDNSRENSTGALPPIENEEEKQKLREDLETEYFHQRNQMKKIENQTKNLELKAEELKIKLKEKETMLRIAKFKLSEVNRNIKHGQLKPIEPREEQSPQKNFLRAKSRKQSEPAGLRPPQPKRNLTSLKKDNMNIPDISQTNIDDQMVDVKEMKYQPVLSAKRQTDKKLVTGGKQTQSQAQIAQNKDLK